MKKITKSLILCFAIFIFTIVNSKAVYAEDNDNLKFEIVEKSEDFKKWENLSEEERKNSIQPLYNTVNIKEDDKKAKYNLTLKAASSEGTLESTYDLRKNLPNIIVKDQKETGSCWAFSFTNALETTLAKKTNNGAKEYSPMHIDYITSKLFNRNVGDGGNPLIALAYSASLYGPVYESDLPFSSVYDKTKNSSNKYYLSDINNVNLNQKVRTKINDATLFASIYKTYNGNEIKYESNSKDEGDTYTYTQEEVNELRKSIKTHIKEDGAISAIMYADFDTANYFNSQKNAYYCNNSEVVANHSITIVGWDDTFKAENFNSTHRPVHDGAYIVLNSYGSSFGENGYIYVSYDDVCIEQLMVGINSVTDNINLDNSRIYEYDELGMSTELEASTSSIYTANVYTRKNAQDIEYLSEIGIFLYETEGVEVYVVPELTYTSDLKNPVASYTGSSALEAGYHTLKLATPMKLEGNKFAIVVKYTSTKNASIPIECDLRENGLSNIETYWDNVTSNRGESYIFTGLRWKDLCDFKVEDKNMVNTNLCIKAFTTYTKVENTTKVTGVTLEQKNLTMNVGDTASLKVTVNPTNAANQNVTWKSSNENVATISKEGVITAKAEGSTTITVTTDDGNFTATCSLTIVRSKKRRK